MDARTISQWLENSLNDGINLYKTYSNEGYIIHKLNTEEYYSEAIDVESSNYEYIETNEKIEIEENIINE